MQLSFLGLLDSRVGLLEYALVLGNTHRFELLRSVILVQDVVGVFAQLFHVRSDEHLSEFDKVAVGFIVNLDDSPRVCSATDVSSIGELDDLVGTDHGKGDFALGFSQLNQGVTRNDPQ